MAYTKRDILKFLKADESIDLNGRQCTYIKVDGQGVVVRWPRAKENDTVFYEHVKKIPQIDLRKVEDARQVSLLVNAGAIDITEPDRVAVTPDSGPFLIEVWDGDYFFGCVKQIRTKQSVIGNQTDFYLDLCVNKESRSAYDALSNALPLLKTAKGLSDDFDAILVANIEHMYALKDVDVAKFSSAPVAPKAAAGPDLVQPVITDKSGSANEATQSSRVNVSVNPAVETRQLTVEPFSVSYLITTQPDGYLPDMTDFTLEREGSVDDGWYSTVPIKGDRALKAGETLSAFLVNRRHGEISRVDWSAPEGKLEPKKWPATFAQHIASKKAAMTAGAWDEDNSFSPDAKTRPLRLWSHAKYRAFTNAPFSANLVQVLACNDDFTMTAGQTLCLQVRDLKTQALFEQHFFQMTDEAGAGWSKPLCEQINRDSHLLRAGALSDDCQVKPSDKGNAFWGPQCAELSVTLTLAHWWKSRMVEGTQALDAGSTLHAWVYDEFSGHLLARHEWTPSAAQRAGGKWLAAWANALNASDVSPYLRAGVSQPTDDKPKVTPTDTLALWHRGDGLRIFTSVPDAEACEAAFALELSEGVETTDKLQITLRHPFDGKALHEAVFTPEPKGETALDQKAWRAAVVTFIKAQAWPELQFASKQSGDVDVWLPRFCELQLELDPVDEDVEPATTTVGALPEIALVPGVGSFQITAGAYGGELAFRLSRAAFDEGLRIAVCVPITSGEDVEWPVSVTADKIIWGARTTSCTYKVTLDCPEKSLSEQERKEKKEKEQKENAQKDKVSKEKQIIGHLGVFSETQFWHASQEVEYIPPDDLSYYEPSSLLCEDYGNTERSEIFDTLGQGESGVDPRTGLFHAHYPVATLQGRNGLGPICDLTLHYSALRGNEAGLGDGWAWRFCSLDVRDRCLTLANGVRITFTSDEWKILGEGTLLKKKHCAVQSNKDYSEFTLDLPSGRREVLSTPQTMPIDDIAKVDEKYINMQYAMGGISADRHAELIKRRAAARNEQEHNAAFVDHIIKMLEAIKEKSKPKFPSTPSHWTQWALIVLSPAAYYIGAKLDYDEAVRAWEKHGKTKELDERIAYYKRPFVQLLPSRIVSLYGETLALEWKRQKGQFLLLGIKSGDEVLFTAEYPSVALHEGDAQVNMQVWPQTDEGFEVKLELQECLLRTLTRAQENPNDKTKKQIVQQVTCGYTDDPTLDRVLCRLTELDGSVECVQYRPGVRPKSGRPLWPQAVLHALIPGDGQENQLTTYRYTGRLLDTSDLLYIVEGERGAHGAREHHLLVFSQDERSQRQELLAGAASVDSQWLEFKARLPAKAETREETKDKDGKPIVTITPRQLARSEVLRYTGFGDDLVEAIDQIKLVAREDKVVVAWGDERVPYHQEIVELLWRPGRGNRTRLIRSIKALLQVCPASQRPAQGQGMDRLITIENDDGLPIELITLDEGSRHNAYYPADGGNNIVTAQVLNGLKGVSGVPQLSCPKLPDHAVPPLMAEYQYDDCGHSLGLKLFGYRAVERDGRTLLELERQVVIEGIGVKGHFDGPLSSSTEWEKTADEVLWRERITSVSPADPKATPSGESKVREWSISDKQVAHLGKEAFTLETTRMCEDNPTRPFIVVRTVSKTQSGSEPISTEHCSRYSQRCLARIEEGVETTWGYDAVGRVVDEAQYRLKPGSTSRGKDQKADRRTRTQYSENGKLATQRYDNGDDSRAYLDGLQRTWRSEWRRAGSAVHLPLYECALQGLDESQVLGSFEWDYLPGGQAVIKRDQVQFQQGRQMWMSERREECVNEVMLGAESLSTEVKDKPEIEVFYRGHQYANEGRAQEFFEALVNLQSYQGTDFDTSADTVEDLVSRSCKSLKDVFEPGVVETLNFLKFIQCLLGLKGQQYIEDVYNGYLLGAQSATLTAVLLEDLQAAPDIEDGDPLMFSAFLDGNTALKGWEDFQAFGSSLFTSVIMSQDKKQRLVAEHCLSNQCLSQRTTEYLTKTDGTFERTQTLSNGTGKQHLKLTQHLDPNGRIISSERIVDDETRTYAFERDALGRVTKITRPDKSLIERTYHGFSNQITELTVGGKVVATQTMVNDSTLKSRKVGSRTYTFDDDSVVLPDKTKLQTQVDEAGVQWDAGDSTVASLTRNEGVTSVTSGSSATDTWKHSFIQPSLPGRRKETQSTPRGESKTVEWLSLRGNTVASLRADGHLQRAFADHEGRVLRTCQEHEDVAYRYDPLGQLQSRQVQALMAGEQWQVLSEHDGFGQEVTRTFLLNGAPRFEHRMTWRGDGRLASKASYEAGVLRSTERFSYDLLDRLERYTCEAEKAKYCPKDAEGKAVKAQVFTWDALDNLVSCVTTDYDGSDVIRAFSYDAKDPTRMIKAQRGAQSENLSWSSNGYLEAAEAQGPKFAYNACGQLSKVSDASNELARYEYDGYQRLVAQYVKQDETTRELRYDGDELIGEIWFDKKRAVTRRTSVSAGLAEYDGEEVRWLIDDPQVGIAGQVKGGNLSLAPLLPFGEGAALDEVVVGYNGMRRDPVTGQYHAGNGYRSYDPTLCRYAQPDWLAPVGEGGINPYQHCPDPVNLHDPSGAIMLSRWEQQRDMQDLEQELKDTQAMEVGGKWRGLALSLVLTVIGVVATVFSGGTAAVWLFAALTALSVASFGLEVASVLTAESNPGLSKALGIASMATGILSAACFMGPIKAAVSVLKQTIRVVGRVARYVGRGAKALGRGVVRLLKGQRSAASIAKGALGALPRPTWGMRLRTATRTAMRTVFREVDDFFGAPASLQPMPTYDRSGWLGKLMSAWDGPDPTKLTGRPARLYAWANQSRFVSKVNELGGLAIEANILRGTVESSRALAQGDDSSSISVQARASLRINNKPYRPRRVTPRYDLRRVLGLSG